MSDLILKLEEDGIAGRHLQFALEKYASGEMAEKNACLLGLVVAWGSYMLHGKALTNIISRSQHSTFF